MKRKNAISLIVLVITIIVMSILAATIIITLSNTNIIDQAKDAVEKTEAQQIEEAKAIILADGIMGNTPEPITIGDTTLAWDSDSKTVVEKTTKDGTTKVDTVTIPAGFYYVGGTKNTGLVISDATADENKGVDYTCVGNQFVWVPVEYTATGTKDENGLDTGFTSVFKRGEYDKTTKKMTGSTVDVEPYSTDTYTSEVTEYNNMMKSVQKNYGFYIARFEAGDGDVTSERTAETEAHKVVSKKGAIVYDNVPWGTSLTDIGSNGAVYLSKKMYENSASVKSTLCYGVQWDAVCNWLSDSGYDINTSSSWGNYDDSSGAATANSGSLNTTGKSEAWKANNIYDFAGNAYEITMETCNSNMKRARGGAYSDSFHYNRAASRFLIPANVVSNGYRFSPSTIFE